MSNDLRIYDRDGDIPFAQFRFPDGQTHVEIPHYDGTRGISRVTVEAAIRDPDQLMTVLVAKSALESYGLSVALDLRYLFGQRMDRRIGVGHPATLDIVTRLIVSAGFRAIRVLDPHSWQTLKNLRASAVYPTTALVQVLNQYDEDRTVIVAPDAGATERVVAFLRVAGLRRDKVFNFQVLQGRKHRNPETGELTAFSVDNASFVSGKQCLMMDDLCDGGGTFTGLAEILWNHDAIGVDLFVTHGLFTKGTPIKHVQRIYTTDSYAHVGGHLQIVYPIQMRDLERPPAYAGV